MELKDIQLFAAKYAGDITTRNKLPNALKWLADIKSCYKRCNIASSTQAELPREFEWLLDNWYLAEREGREAAAYIDKKLTADVFYLARGLVRFCKNKVDEDIIRVYLEGAQQAYPLTEKQLSVFIPALVLALTEAVADICGEFDAEMEKGAITPRQELELLCENVFTSLRFLSIANLTQTLEKVNLVERILREDPTGVYPLMDEPSRAWYRRQISDIAEKKKITEQEAAKAALEASRPDRHIGFQIINNKRRSGFGYILAIILPSVLLTLLPAIALGVTWMALLLLLPVSEIVKNLVDYIILRAVKPTVVPRLELKEELPPEGKTLCVISTLMTNESGMLELMRQLEEYSIANRGCGENLCFGLLVDLPDSSKLRNREELSVLSAAVKAAGQLNKTYGDIFYIFFRMPVFNHTDGCFMGWERKRGAIVELTRFLMGRPSGLLVEAGNAGKLRGVKYIIALDSDTRLNVGAARELVGAMLHPLNKPVIDTQKGIVTAGHAILQPRISVDLRVANRSQFSRIFAGQGGIDPYGSTTSDVYQDLFDEGTFTGKGIIDVNAFYICLNNRFPENRILSHDLLEGAYLRAGLIGDVELTDSCPFKVTSYYSRLHRWVRGDWQTASWMFKRSPSGYNPISTVSRWKIFDNLRRSLVPVFTVIGLVLGLLIDSNEFIFAVSAALLCLLSNLLISGAEHAVRRSIGWRFHSTIIAGISGALLQTFVQVMLLPYNAGVSVSAICTTLYRLKVSNKGLLSWVTAAEAERRAGGGVLEYYRKQLSSVAAGILVLVFSRHVIGGALGALWIAAPWLSSLLSRPDGRHREPDDADRGFLLHEAALIWRYFEDFLTKENNWLPPDNWQEQPGVGVAARTSPTNIGLALLCVLAAADMNIITADKALRLIDNMLTTIEAMEKWNGHLLNWYDILTLEPLRPRSVSTVDSGNYVGCLIALKEGLRELKNDKAEQLAVRAENLAKVVSFKELYDNKRKLFYISYDLESEKPTESRYDLLASEARQASYIAIARGEVDRKHWSRLGRSLVTFNRYCGMVSWTGTMFEYLMPNILMPCYKNSLLYESNVFCVYVQKKHTGKLPWGISEGAFYAFDSALNYQYKAHGVQRLGLKRGLNRELVISPYSSFLALEIAPEMAVKNLRRMRKIGLEGRYGFYEAIDYTNARLNQGQEYEIVRCFMVHHLGMSMISVANTLYKSVMQKRFMRDSEMGAYAELLKEKVPVGAVVMTAPIRKIPDKPKRIMGDDLRREKKDYTPWSPSCHLLSNRYYTVILTDTGLSCSKWGDLNITRFESRQDYTSAGFYFKTENELISLQPMPDFDSAMRYTSAFESCSSVTTAVGKGIICSIETRVPDNENGELREVMLQNSTGEAITGELVFSCEPVLARREDFEAHPAFSKLFLETEIIENGVVIRRRPGGNAKSVCMVFLSERGARFDTSREKAFGRGVSLKAAMEKKPGNTGGQVLDPCLLCRVKLTLAPGESVTARFAITIGADCADTMSAAERLISQRKLSCGYVESLCRSFEMTAADVDASMELLKELMFITRRRKELDGLISGSGGGRDLLWGYGISGDLPIITAEAGKEHEPEKIKALIIRQRFLSACGIKSDLVLITDKDADYQRSLHNRILDLLKKADAEYTLGAKGGVHIVESRESERLKAFSRVYIDFESKGHKAEIPELHRTKPAKSTNIISLEYGYNEDNSFWFRGLPDSSWSNVLYGAGLGYIASDSGTGNLWYDNARENKLTLWKNDLLSTSGPERLSLILGDGREVSVFSDTDGYECRVTFGFGFACWEKNIEGRVIKTTAFISKELPVRIFIVEGTGRLRYLAEPVMGSSGSDSEHVVSEVREGALVFTNPFNTDYKDQRLIFTSSPNPREYTCDLADTDNKMTGGGLFPCANMEIDLTGIAVICSGVAFDEKGASQLMSLADADRAENELHKTKAYWRALVTRHSFETPDKNLNHYLNGWNAYQSIACRILARCSAYQCGGAYGFRDQLQDVSSMVAYDRQLARSHILRSAKHQFEQGDVLHWWHETRSGEDKGVRTRISDDLLWLPFVIAEYVRKTGDTDILAEKAQYLASQPLKDGENERYNTPEKADLSESLYEHGLRALELVLKRGAGEHGLTYMGGGDWNDGFNKVGIYGRGESIWLSWFLAVTLEKYAKICAFMGEPERGEKYLKAAKTYTEAANKAWEGQWYVRGFYDSGKVMGCSRNEECQIDSIAQSFSVLPVHSDLEKSKQALENAYKRLFVEEHRLSKLFDPPFTGRNEDPGYIRGYVPGVRENGGQYNHASVWLAMAYFILKMPDKGWNIMRGIMPSGHDLSKYRVEPFVLAADIYTNPFHLERGGWSWYTGSASWFFAVTAERILGIRRDWDTLSIKPMLPPEWDGYRTVWQDEDFELEIIVKRGEGTSALDGKPRSLDEIDIKSLKGTHKAELFI